ncbi:hypothetical protein FH972_016839 [Carpinus fangiana]|uniref:Uncharacterized protein n=1 Tax=Carpinus fangiana TaxID=176857 RepID=A0A5N6RH45_9ROSI|nr:hypothetical protein FH972_016839 [Carpinus fangiana]
MDAADHGYGEDHKPGLLGGEEGVHVALTTQVELGVGVQNEASEAQVAELLHDGQVD